MLERFLTNLGLIHVAKAPTSVAAFVRDRDALRNYQRFTVDLIKRVWAEDDTKIPGIILALDMGAGKTISTLTAIADLIKARKVRKVLIVAPLLVAETVWPVEIAEWAHTKHLRCSVITGEADNRARAAMADADVYVVNKENVPWLWDFWKGRKWPYDGLVIDEASMLKNGKKRTKNKTLTRFGALAAARKHFTGVIELTGTPAPNGLKNLWGLAYIVDQGQRLGGTKKAFDDRWFDINQWSYKVTEKPNARDEITSRLSDIMFSLTPDLNLENPEYVHHRIPFDKKVFEEYKQFEKTLVSEIYDVEAVNSAVLINKLLQYSNGSMYQEDGNDIFVHDHKLEALKQIHEEADGVPLLVAYSFKFDLARIKKAFPKAVVLNEVQDVRKTVEQWNRGEIDMLLAHPASAGHGLNLQYGSNLAVWYGLTPDLELFQQFNKRLNRPGQTRKVFIHLLLGYGTYDERLVPLLESKAAKQDAVVESVRIHLTDIPA